MDLELPTGACRLDDWGVVLAEGPDAAAFLHAQLTQAVTDLPADRARLGGYCSPKGRLVANFMLWRAGDEAIALALPQSVLPATLKRLSMYLLRSKAKLRDASAEVPLWGVLGDAVPAAEPWTRSGPWLHLPAGSAARRALHLGDPGLEALPHAAWAYAEVLAGLPFVQAATAEHFVPQMLNQELLGGVNFQKGCYPGQEVVARSQYRGTVKRRTQHLTGGQAAPGSELFDGPGREQPVGEVVMAAAWGDAQSLLAELTLAAWESEAALQLADGTPLMRAALPYRVVAAA